VVLFGDKGQVEARFGLFIDGANLDARQVHGLGQTYHRPRKSFWMHQIELLGDVAMDICKRTQKRIHKRTDIGEHFTREIFPEYRICLSTMRKRAMTNLNLYLTPGPHYKVAKI
jgi:hypothetical protein